MGFDAGHHGIDDALRAHAVTAFKNLDHAFLAEEVLLFIHGFGNAVAVYEADVAGLKRRFKLVEARDVEGAYKRAADVAQPPDGLLGRSGEDGRRAVAAVGIDETPRAAVENADPERYEHHVGIVGSELVVHLLDRLRRHEAVADCVANERERHAHEERRGDALAGHVAEDEHLTIVGQLEDVVEIAADLLGRIHDGGRLHALGAEAVRGVGEHAELNFMRGI